MLAQDRISWKIKVVPPGGVSDGHPELEEFARLVVRHVRDSAIRENDFRLSTHAKVPKAKRWREAASKMTPEEFTRMLIPDVVDTVIFELLRAMDEGVLPLSFTGSSGTTVDLTKDQDGLVGRYVGSDGWCGQYAQERYAEDYTESCEDFIRELLSKFKK